MLKTSPPPSGQVSVDFELTGKGVPTYHMTYKGTEVIKPSTLGLELNGKAQPHGRL